MNEQGKRSLTIRFSGSVVTVFAAGVMTVALAGPAAAQEKKPTILFIMGDDVG